MRKYEQTLIDRFLNREVSVADKNMNITTSRDTCEVCKGKGRVFDVKEQKYKVCENCADLVIDIKEDIDNSKVNAKVSDEDIENYLKDNNAPIYVYDKDYQFNIEEIRGDSLLTDDVVESVEFGAYLRKMNALNMMSIKGNMLKRSYLITSDRGLGKTYLQWAVLKNYYRQGIKVSPAFLVEDLYYIKKEKGSLHELISRYDIIQLNLISSVDKSRNLYMYNEVVNKCKFENKPIIVYTILHTHFIVDENIYTPNVLLNTKEGKYGDLMLIEYHRTYKKEKTLNKMIETNNRYKGIGLGGDDREREPFNLSDEEIEDITINL